MRARWAAAALVVLSLASCSESTSSGATDDPTLPSSSSPTADPTPTETGGAEEVCPYLTAEQVTTAIGAPVTETAGTVHACFFDPVSGTGPSVMLSRVDVEIDPADYATQTRALCQGEVTDVELGDQAFACVMGLGPQGQLYTGKVLITVNINGAADDAAGITMAAALLHDVTIPPPA